MPGSSLARESDLTLMTRAGPEIGVASTKAFTTQLTALMLLTLALGRVHGQDAEEQASLVEALRGLPARVERVLALDAEIEDLSTAFAEKHHALFLGRGAHFPVALEGRSSSRKFPISTPRPTRRESSSMAPWRWSTATCR